MSLLYHTADFKGLASLFVISVVQKLHCLSLFVFLVQTFFLYKCQALVDLLVVLFIIVCTMSEM